MQLKSSSPKGRDYSPKSGSRVKQKHKRLDAICENVYNQNHQSESKPLDDANSELRRSSRVRRAPVVLDVSPPPVKKRKKLDKNVKNVNLSVVNRRSGSGRGLRGVEIKEGNEQLGFLDTPGSWRSRLRSRGRVRNLVSRERGETSRKRKLFDEEVEMVEKEFDDDEKLMVLKLKRLGRVKAVNGLGNEMKNDEDNVSGKDDGKESVGKDEIEGVEEGMPVFGSEIDGGNEMEVVRDEVEECVPVLVDAVDGGNEREEVDDDGDAVQLRLDKQEEKDRLDGLELEKNINENYNVENVEQGDRKMEEVDTRMDVENEGDVEVDETPMNDVEDPNKEGNVVEIDETLMNEVKDPNNEGDIEVNEIPLEVEKVAKAEKSKHDSHTLGRPQVKQGRWCGLCGCANDGKPPKKLIQDAGDSENETYSGSSASEEPNYDIWDGFGDEPSWLGRLLGPINDRHGIAGIWVHQHCAVWSPEVYFAGLGCLKNVRAALCRGRALKCTRCGRPGATIGCRVDRCPKTYHLPCARANGCIFYHRKFLIACTDHRHLFQPYGNQNLMRIKKLKARKMKLEVRKRSNDAWRKDIEAEEKWLENCGEDEEFLKRESKRLHRDLLRIAPAYIGGSDSESLKLFEGWDSVAGLKDVIQCMKEVVILPLLYPEFFNNLGITPPRGVLLHGYPGTGKTLVVRALIGSCARGDKRIAYFARKGADCLGKYVGDAERQLRLLFQVAEKCQPSIIFFDEIDGLAPCRTRQQDQTHSSVVSTLLALMDGLKSRGSVVVIGATNRPEAVDPALRRPGRFDREIYFPLPSIEDRAAILSLHTRRWPKPVTGSLLHWVASRTVGFAGADLQALCSQAAIIALKRNFPLHEMLSAAEKKAPGANCVPLPAFTVEERDWLEALACAPPPCSRREAGIAANDLITCPLPVHLIPCLLCPLTKLLVSLHLDERLWLPPPLSKAATMVKSVIISTLAKKNLPSNQWWFHVDNLLKQTEVANEIQRRLSVAGILIEENSYTHAHAIDENDDDGVQFEPSVCSKRLSTSFLRGISLTSRKKGYRILVAGGPRSGQRHVASCMLNCFLGNVEVQKVDLATISQEGHGDLVLGITQLLMKCASFQSLVIFMPRIDLWAVEACRQVTKENGASSTDQLSEKTECYSPSLQDVGKENASEKAESCYKPIQDVGQEKVSEKTESYSTPIEVNDKENETFAHKCRESEMQQPQNATLIASHSWCSFVEQVENISVSTSLIILATSEIPYLELPQEIMQFFESDVSNSTELTPLEHTVPRFSVHVGDDFNRDLVVSLSAAKLLGDITQLFVLLIHQKAHIHTTSVQYKFCDSVQTCATENQFKKNGSGVENDFGKAFPHDHSKVASPPSNKSLKGKSSLLLAISAFGYQILRCPHFAELCWVTSKLKEGPCADFNGPWKGWPFNSCFIHPGNMDNVPATYSTGNIKSKDKYSLVRGLIAVGLSAYRGVYKSLREVSFEVRKVLELLVGQVNEKIQAGKDRYQYIRLLSQVAYLEDMVNSWAHALQSLELDNQIKLANAGQSTPDFPCDYASVENSIQNEECRGVIPNKSAQESEGVEGSPVKLAPGNVEGVQLIEGENGFGLSGSDIRGVLSEDLSPKQNVHCDHTNLDKNLQSFTSDNQLVDKNTDEQNGITLGQREPKNTSALKVVTGLDNGSLKHSNGLTVADIGVHSEGGVCNSSEQCTNKFAGPSKPCDRIDGMVATEEGAKCKDNQPNCSDFSPGKDTSHFADCEVVCSYICCYGCLHMLQKMIQEVLVHKWELNNSHWRVDDVHDVVSSLSVDLLSAVRKANVTSDSIHGNLRCANPDILSESSEMQNCRCQSSGNSLALAAECSCHSMAGFATAKANGSPNSDLRIELEFIFRDGVLVPVDTNKNISFHCKYETLCLCSIIKSVVMMKQPSD
ncbi:uncharacterized protein LOC8268832 [Ricinus communis]|uniref:uncharacterized protein LOC8268832 n=1 Tax=Ricinus communis TaxID=3988 RepID=UPI00201ADDC7|nr:uncharacterized protein LOC8268832 [Ricinus communis]